MSSARTLRCTLVAMLALIGVATCALCVREDVLPAIENAPHMAFAQVNSNITDRIVSGEHACPVGFPGHLGLPSHCTVIVSVNSSDFAVPYQVSGTIYNATLDSGSKSLRINYTEDTNLGLSIILPRLLIDSRNDNADSNFTITIDGKALEYSETKSNSTTRELLIPAARGDHEVVITGTNAAPEFTLLAFMITSAPILLAIIYIRKTLSFGITRKPS